MTSKVMLLGDTHGNDLFVINRIIPAAVEQGVEWIYQVGDFGYWEHTEEGKQYLNKVDKALIPTGISLLFLKGNHDKVSLIPQRYPLIDGFYLVRPNIWYAADGTQWHFQGRNFLALGGAYSVDKQLRLDNEKSLAARKFKELKKENKFRNYADGYVWEAAREMAHAQYWFPEEQMTDEELDDILNNVEGEIDVILAHDKPLSSNPMVKLLPIDECIPNQRRLQKAVNFLQPKLFVHGHLHVRYTDTIRCGNDDRYTRVEGLGADVPNFNQLDSDWTPKDAWEILNL